MLVTEIETQLYIRAIDGNPVHILVKTNPPLNGVLTLITQSVITLGTKPHEDMNCSYIHEYVAPRIDKYICITR